MAQASERPSSVLVPRPSAFADFYRLGPERDHFWDEAIQWHQAPQPTPF